MKMEPLMSSTPLPPSPPSTILGDENAPPPGTHLVGSLLRPTRKTRTTFRELTNALPETPRVRAPRKRKATGGGGKGQKKASARSSGVKKIKLEMELETPPELEVGGDILDKIPDLEEGHAQETKEGQLMDDNLGPPELEKMELELEEGTMTEKIALVAEDDTVKMPALTPNYPDEEDHSLDAAVVPVDETPAKPITPTKSTLSLENVAAPSKKRKKTKGRNGNIYIGVLNRIIWLKLQEQFGFDNINNFGNFVMGYMSKVFEDFQILHQVAVDVGIFAEQGLSGFTWVNGLPHPVNEAGTFLQLPEVVLSEEYCKRAFEVTYDLCVKRGKFLVELASGSLGDGDGKPEETEEDGDDHEEGQDGDQGESSNSGQSQDAGQNVAGDGVASSSSSSAQDVGVVSSSSLLPPKEEECSDNKNSVAESEAQKGQGQDEDGIAPRIPSFSSPEFHVPEVPKGPEEITFQLEYQTEGTPSLEAISDPISLDLNFNLGTDTDEVVTNKENVAPTGSQSQEVDTANKEMDSKRSALRQILGDISLESICSPENWTPQSTPK